jgi:hypothetical protein
MLKILSNIILLLYAPIFIIELFLYFFFKKKNSESSHQYLIKLFSIFGNKPLKLISFFLSYRKKKIINKINIENIFNARIILRNIVINLNKKGFFLIKNFLKKEVTKNILKFLNTKKGFYYSDIFKSEKMFNLNLSKPKGTKFTYKANDLIESADIQNLLVSPAILSVAQNYLGCLPKIDILTAWWSFPSKKADSNAAQYWHFDLDRPKWIKVFIFLTHCGNKNGPHKYIEKSHKHISSDIRRKGYVRLIDEEVENYGRQKDVKVFTATQGSVLFEDTLGLHKGQTVENGSRLILQFQYSSALFGSRVEKIKLPKHQSENFMYYRDKYKEMFEVFN